MKVLVISHNVFSMTESMGKTLTMYFSEFKPEDIAQFYIHPENPTSAVCHNYYRMTDTEAIKSILGLSEGRAFGKNDILCDLKDNTTKKVTQSLYQRARKRTPIIYIMRNMWWGMAHLYNRKFREWLDEFNPDCVFFASGDYVFMYKIARKISQKRNIPLYVSCMDDYYIFNKNENKLFGKTEHKYFMREVKKTIRCADKLFCICDKMSEDYHKLFNKDCITIHTPATIDKVLSYPKTNKISYLGNLGYNRDKQLIAIGKALKELNLCPNHIDIYSFEIRDEILTNMTQENGIVFHGAVGADEVLKVIGESMAVIHVESFERRDRNSVRYSVSTKIADSLMSGTCIFAFGPKEIASIDYLNQNDAAICCTDSGELIGKLKELISDTERRKEVIKNAKILSQNHSQDKTPKIIYETLTKGNKI